MIALIYDCYGRDTEIKIRESEVRFLIVKVLSGDEVVTAYYEDGKREDFDSSISRVINHFEGEYFVDKKDIEAWAKFNFKSEERDDYSDERLKAYEG